MRDSVLEGIYGGGRVGGVCSKGGNGGCRFPAREQLVSKKWKFKPFLKEELGFRGPWEVAQLLFWSPGDTTSASETGSEIARGIPWSPRGSWSGFSSSFGVILG